MRWRIGRSDVFVPVDTEALRPEDVTHAPLALPKKYQARCDGLDRWRCGPPAGRRRNRRRFCAATVSGLLTARFLNADAVVTPVTSNTAIELSGLFAKVYRTRVGSPYVIEGDGTGRQGWPSAVIVGFEANGGVLLGSAVDHRSAGNCDALPTRDAMLPILAVLGMAARDRRCRCRNCWTGLACALHAERPHRARLTAEQERPVPARPCVTMRRRAGFFAGARHDRGLMTPSMASRVVLVDRRGGPLSRLGQCA